MLDRLLTSSFYALPGDFLGDPLFPIGHMMMSLHFLPMLLPLPGESTYHSRSRQAVILRMRYKYGRITASFTSLPTFEGKTSAGY